MFKLIVICSLLSSVLTFECPGNGYFRDPLDCAKMVRCSNGKVTHRFSCGEGKVFNDLTKACEDPKYVNCQITSTTKQSTSPSSVTINESIPNTTELPVSTTITTISDNSTPSSSTSSSSTQSSTTQSSSTQSSTTQSSSTQSSTTQSSPTQSSSTQSSSTQSSSIESSSISSSSTPISSTDPSSISSTTTSPQTTDSSTENTKNSELLTEKPILLNKTSVMINESFVEYEDEEEEKEVSSTTTPMTTALSVNESNVTTTSSPIIPTSFASNVSPVLESTLQNDTTQTDLTATESTATESTATESTTITITETTTKSNKYCSIEESQMGLRMISSNYSTNETSKLSDFYKVVCYFTNWSRYRSDSGKFTINNINPFLCTHIIYSFAVLDNETLTLKSSDECTDIDNQYYAQITGLKKKNPKLKILIALGGWVDSEGDKYSRLVNNKTSRTNFVHKVIDFIIKHDFDGLDLDWEFPKCWQSNCSAGPHSDQINFSKLIRELRIAFNKQSIPLLLTAAVSANKEIIDAAYDINSLMFNLDFINLMAYDYYTPGGPSATHHSPLYLHPNLKSSNVNDSTIYWINKGIASHKIILGIPFYGRAFKLVNSTLNDIGAPINGSGDAGLLTKEKGFLSYYEICANIVNKGWAKRVDSYIYEGIQVMTGPYAFDSDQWVGYDDRDHVIQKTKYIKELNLGGAMIWALDLDDFNGICCRVKSPLLKTINHELRTYKFDLNFFCP